MSVDTDGDVEQASFHTINEGTGESLISCTLAQFQGEGRFSSPFQFPLGHLGDKEIQHAFKEGMLALSPRVIRFP